MAFSPLPPYSLDSDYAGQVMSREDTDARVVAIVGVSYIETYMAEALRKKLKALTPDLDQRLFEGFGPLATAKSRLLLLEAWGTVSARTSRDISTLLKIRNLFAHNVRIDSFDQEDVAKLCRRLSDEGVGLTDPLAPKETSGAWQWLQTPRGRFVMTAANIQMGIHNWLVSVDRADEAAVETAVAAATNEQTE